MINVLKPFCDRWKMKINIEKTQIMVFRRGGKIWKDETFYIGEKLIEMVNCYKYLGIFFTPCLEWSLAVTTLAQQASRAQTMLIIYNKKSRRIII